jgi:chromosome segregation ATPase
VNYFAPALRELARLVARQWHRLWLVLARRKLVRLETALGLLGWQQAYFDSSTQLHVDRLNGFDREQARLNNESAVLGLAIHRLEQQRATARQEFEDAMAEALAREQSTAANEAALEEQITAARKELKEAAARLPILDRELAAAEAQYRELIQPAAPTPKVQEELLRLRNTILTLPREQAEWRARREQIAGRLSQMQALSEMLRQTRAEFQARDAVMADEITGRQREKQKVEKEINALEAAKADPYREVGRALADQAIAPLNQPEALAAVLAQRQAIGAREARLTASLATSGAEDRTRLWKSCLAVAALVGSAVGLFWLATGP